MSLDLNFDWDAELHPEERDALIEKIARQVTARGMQIPAIIFLEMHKPLAFLAGQGILFSSGFLAPIFGPKNVQQYSRLFESRDNIELLIRRIEAIDVAKIGHKD